MTKTRIAVLGAGFMGGTHARAHHARDDVEIAAVYAHGPARGQDLADELGTAFTDDLDQVLRDDSIEAVDICLPTPAHRATAEAALAAGKHVLLEKPLALTIEDADALVAAADATDRVFMVAHVLRFWPEYVALKRVVDSGELGRPIAVNAVRRQPFPEWSALLKNADQTGGAIYDMLIHDYDAINWLLGAPASVVAHGIRNPRSGGHDQAQALITYAAGTGVADGGAIEYHFQAGGRSFEVGTPTNRLTVYRAGGDPEVLPVEQSDPFANEVAYFIDCVRTGAPAARATPRAARLAMQVGLAAKASAETGQRIVLDPLATSL